MIGCSKDVALWVTPVGSRVVSLHEFGEVRCEAGCWVLGSGCGVGGGANRIFM